MSFNFDKINSTHFNTIMKWLDEDHVREFWDNSQEHRDDIRIFIEGRKETSQYFGGLFDYWVGSYHAEPFCFLMTSPLLPDENLPDLWTSHLSKTGKTFSLDFCIGEKHYLGKGLASEALREFIIFFQTHIEPLADVFIMDPAANNPRAFHVYAKAGFIPVGIYAMQTSAFKGQEANLMVLQTR